MRPRKHTVGTSTVRLVRKNNSRTSIIIYNTHATAIVYVWHDRDTGTNGWPIQAGASLSFKVPEEFPNEELWIVSDTASTIVFTWEGFGFIDPNWIKPEALS